MLYGRSLKSAKDQWEGDLLHEFMQTHAKDAYEKKRQAIHI